MIDFKLSELANAGGFALWGEDKTVKAVSTDSRNCQGALFVAIKGERFDGNDYLKQALANGAAALVCSADKSGLDALKASLVVCPDTVRALGLCGLLVREKSRAKVVSLTGSCGKTTVKELTASILSENGSTVSTYGNLNNDIGVPLTLLRLDADTKYAVIEQGASHPLDLKRTCQFVKSQAALINNAGSAHIEGFGSLEGVYLGKSEILDDVLLRGGIGIVPSFSHWFSRWKTDYASYFAKGRILTFGTGDNDFVAFKDVSLGARGLECTLRTPNLEFRAKLALLGAHNAANAAAACALALSAGALESTLGAGLERAPSIKGRLFPEIFKTFALIDDSYNASFNAVLSALDVLSSGKGHRVMIFGDMGELGSEALKLHADVGDYALGKADELWCLGPLSAYACKAAPGISKHFNCLQDLVQYAKNCIQHHAFTTFVVKGSHSMHMNLISDELRKVGEKDDSSAL